MIYSILIASAVPLIFLFLIKWLNFFETHRARLIFLALAWGAFSVELSYLVDHPLVALVGRQYLATHSAPVVEEIFKSLILVYLVRRADYKHFVDGAIYGLAAGLGFAIAENMLYLSRVDVNTGLILAVTRAFSTSVMHGSATAFVGIAIGGFPLTRAIWPWLALIIGWIIAIAYHISFNRFVFARPGFTGLLILVGMAFAGLMLVAAAILWGLAQERRRLRKSLGPRIGVSKGEAGLIQHIEDLDDMLAPVEKRFGAGKREQVAHVLLLAAQLGMQEEQIRKTKDAELRVELAAQITEAKRELKRQRRAVGMYAMSYVRSIVPKARWSLWARLGQALIRIPPAGSSMWTALGPRLGMPATTGVSLYAYVQARLDTRRQAAPSEPAAGDELSGAMGRFMQWVRE